jgi:hypothetical protein
MNAATYDAIESLRLVHCGHCGCLYAVPAGMAQAGQTIHCPHGHAWAPEPAGLDAAAMILNLQGALADARCRLEAARLRIEALTPLAEPSLTELRRRSRLLAEHAEDAGQGRALCPFCGSPKWRERLAEHVRRRHRQLLVENGAGGEGGAEKGEAG